MCATWRLTRHILGLRHKSTLVLVLIFTAGDLKTHHLDLTLLTLIVGIALTQHCCTVGDFVWQVSQNELTRNSYIDLCFKWTIL